MVLINCDRVLPSKAFQQQSSVNWQPIALFNNPLMAKCGYYNKTLNFAENRLATKKNHFLFKNKSSQIAVNIALYRFQINGWTLIRVNPLRPGMYDVPSPMGAVQRCQADGEHLHPQYADDVPHRTRSDHQYDVFI